MKPTIHDLLYSTDSETESILKKEGNQLGRNFNEWHGVFTIMSFGRRYHLSEMEVYSILSNRYEIKEKTEK